MVIQESGPTISRGKQCHSQPHINARLELQMQFDRGNPELSSLFCLPNFITMAQMLSFVTLQLHVFISLSLNMTLTNDCSIVPRSQASLRIEIFILGKDDRMHTEHLTLGILWSGWHKLNWNIVSYRNYLHLPVKQEHWQSHQCKPLVIRGFIWCHASNSAVLTAH